MPLYTIGLGSPEPARDLELTELLVDDVVFVDDAVRFQAKLLARGFAGEKVVVRLKELDPGSTDPKAARELESIEVELPADGQPKRVELVHRPKTTGELTFILEVDPQPRELQTDNNRIERVDHRPQGEAQGPLRRQRAALRVPLPEELPRARRDDRPERGPALVRPEVQRAGPLGPADLSPPPRTTCSPTTSCSSATPTPAS